MKKSVLSVILVLCMLLSVPAFASAESITLDNIRDYVVGLDTEVELGDGTMQPAINFDNGATTPALTPVLEAVEESLTMYGSIGRGKGQKSTYSTAVYEATRDKVLSFVNADPDAYTVFYVNNTTDGLNKLASALIGSEDDVVLTSRMEHHANDLSWRERCTTIYAEVDEYGRLDLADMERLLREYDGAVDYVSVTAASNVTGYVNDVHAIAKLAHSYGAKIIVDGAQIVAHRAFSMLGDTPEENIDFFVFSAHKMYSPFGGGAVVGLTDVLNEHLPEFYGGGIVDVVSDYDVTFLSAPERYEAGSPNYPGVVGLGAAIDILEEVGFDAIAAHEQALLRRVIDGLLAIDGVTVYGDTENIADKVGVVTFNIDGIGHGDVANALAENAGVAVRQGAFCSHPYVFRLLGIPDEEITEEMYEDDFSMPGMVRVSFGIYNTEEEVDAFLEAVRLIAAEAAEASVEPAA